MSESNHFAVLQSTALFADEQGCETAADRKRLLALATNALSGTLHLPDIGISRAVEPSNVTRRIDPQLDKLRNRWLDGLVDTVDFLDQVEEFQRRSDNWTGQSTSEVDFLENLRLDVRLATFNQAANYIAHDWGVRDRTSVLEACERANSETRSPPSR